MGDFVFINGLAAVHKTSSGKAVIFPDVCLCPPTPPAGPVPTPLPNNVKAADLDGAATNVLIEGNPAGHAKSFFKMSSGNECARSTGGGVMTAQVQGKAFWQSFSFNVFIEGEPAVRHSDLVTGNHGAQPAGNTPPAPWMSTMDIPPVPPAKIERKAGEGKEWIELVVVNANDKPMAKLRCSIKFPDGGVLTTRTPAGGAIKVIGLAAGRCEVTFPGISDAPAPQKGGASQDKGGSQPTLRRGSGPLQLQTGKTHKISYPGNEGELLVVTDVATKDADKHEVTYTLESRNKRYKKILSTRRDGIKSGEWVDLFFTDIPEDAELTLRARRRVGKQEDELVFDRIAFAAISAGSDDDKEPK